MDERSQELLNEILKVNPTELNEDQIKFLRARRSYLKDSQLEEYKSVLEDQTSKKETVNKNGSTKQTK